MPIIYEYQTNDGDKILIQADEPERSSNGYRDGGNTRGGSNTRDADSGVTKIVKVKFEEALGTVKAAATALKNVMGEIKPDEVEVEFSVKVEGEAGIFAICKATTGAEFKIKLTWKNEKAKQDADTNTAT